MEGFFSIFSNRSIIRVVIGPAFLIGGDILKGPDRHNSPGAYREEERQPRLKEFLY